MVATSPRLGIVDWGIGGLGLLRLVDRDLPGLDVVYWSDTGAVPYGLQSTGDLAARLRYVITQLADRGCTEVVLGCNAASTVVDRLASSPIPVAGIIEAGIAAVPTHLEGVIGVIGGRRTIRSGAYRRGLTRPDRTVVGRIAQPLSAHIEAGRIESPEFQADLHQVVEPLRGADAVILACTHYPAATPQFAEALPGTLLVDPAEHLAGGIVARLRGSVGALAGKRTILTTGDVERMRSSARHAWGTILPEITSVAVD